MRARASLGRRRVLSTVALAIAVAWTAACGAPVDLKASLKVAEVATGWFDQGIVDGQNKLVPSIGFTLSNLSERQISSVQINVVFRRVGEAE